MAEWLPLEGDLHSYEVSRIGELRRIGSDSPLRLRTRRYIGTKVQGRNVEVHTLVAAAFLGPRPLGMEVRHLNGDSHDNRSENLRYGTKVQNAADRAAHGTEFNANKERCPQGHAYDAANTYLYTTPRGFRSRGCRTCNREAVRRYQTRTRVAP